ncbi:MULTISPECIES: GNAT family N-acetyltransferase [unclassified Streptomyces]|uniref:GNAT family N-acetyltransferase n=1 Tax=Streptomyces sp. R33 TaxID=3238629 RepID=A0AB39Y7W3_9ACTN|nr:MULTISPECIES: GNAT family N-acetyltransferase [unclassified Streptomyces]KOY57052.1 GCN5 family acetyltransferase [Streptomyces sp. XY332]TDU77167.1 putative acetyltransferase [Streptomyces sp. KS 21]THA35036.1 GNAT family N-acetyltransferase [Streptomyces sp. A1547]
MPELILPSPRLHASWLAARGEWGPDAHMDGAGLGSDDDVDSAEGFAAWTERLHRYGDRTLPVEQGRVHATYWWIAEDDTYLGAIDLRHYLNGFLLDAGGHIGYGVRPSARGRGLAGWALREVLHEARIMGMDRVLLTCDPDNAGSVRTIERGGGVLEDVRETLIGPKRRYWIDL